MILIRIAALAALACLAACQTAPTRAETRASDSYANFLVGHVANRRDDHQAASDRYFSALSRDPADVTLVEGALAAALATGDRERAREIARRARGEGVSASAHLLRAADALTRSELQRAASEIDGVEGSAASELAAGMMLAWVRTGEGRVDDVLIDLAPLASVRPYGGLFAYQQAMALDFSGRQDEALAAYDLGDRSQLWLPSAVARHADLLARMGRRQDAANILRATENRIANPALARAFTRLEGGAPIAEAPLTPAEGASLGLEGLAGIFIQENDTTNGLITLSLSLALDPGADTARLAFADAQSKLGHVEAARRVLAEVSPSSVYATNARVLDAWVLFRNGRREEALARVGEETSPRGRRAMADMYRNLERWGEAESMYTALIAENARDWRLYFARGAARDRLSRWPEAEADLRRALEVSPGQPEVANYLGYTLIERGERMQEALSLIESAVAQRPNTGVIVDSLGWAHFRLGDFEQAVAHLERAVELEPANAIIVDHLGDAYWRAGRRIEARFQWQRALTLEATDADRATISAKLEDGLADLPPTRSATR
ncbi:TPR domain protein [alpha proteobacterium U9-1i]|nr:TPR domain protein [alpha proteobacterium U9-1i]